MGGEAVVTTVVECTAPCGVEVEKVALRRVVHPASTQMPYADRESVGEPEREGSGYHPRSGRRGVFCGGRYRSPLGGTTPSSVSNDLFAEYLTGDQFSDICPIALTSTEDDTARDDVLVG